MSQLIVAKDAHGIVLAAEERAVQLDDAGQEVAYEVSRLLFVPPQAALITSGAAESVEMGNALKLFLQEEKLVDIQDIYSAALAFLSTEYERFMGKKCEQLPIDPIHQVSFVLAGMTQKAPDSPFRLYLLWTKKKLPRLDGDEISFAFTLPRRIGLESQINRSCQENAPLAEILARVQAGMARLQMLEEVRFPVSYATLTREGYRPVTPE